MPTSIEVFMPQEDHENVKKTTKTKWGFLPRFRRSLKRLVGRCHRGRYKEITQDNTPLSANHDTARRSYDVNVRDGDSISLKPQDEADLTAADDVLELEDVLDPVIQINGKTTQTTLSRFIKNVTCGTKEAEETVKETTPFLTATCSPTLLSAEAQRPEIEGLQADSILRDLSCDNFSGNLSSPDEDKRRAPFVEGPFVAPPTPFCDTSTTGFGTSVGAQADESGDVDSLWDYISDAEKNIDEEPLHPKKAGDFHEPNRVEHGDGLNASNNDRSDSFEASGVEMTLDESTRLLEYSTSLATVVHRTTSCDEKPTIVDDLKTESLDDHVVVALSNWLDSPVVSNLVDTVPKDEDVEQNEENNSLENVWNSDENDSAASSDSMSDSRSSCSCSLDEDEEPLEDLVESPRESHGFSGFMSSVLGRKPPTAQEDRTSLKRSTVQRDHDELSNEGRSETTDEPDLIMGQRSPAELQATRSNLFDVFSSVLTLGMYDDASSLHTGRTQSNTTGTTDSEWTGNRRRNQLSLSPKRTTKVEPSFAQTLLRTMSSAEWPTSEDEKDIIGAKVSIVRAYSEDGIPTDVVDIHDDSIYIRSRASTDKSPH